MQQLEWTKDQIRHGDSLFKALHLAEIEAAVIVDLLDMVQAQPVGWEEVVDRRMEWWATFRKLAITKEVSDGSFERLFRETALFGEP